MHQSFFTAKECHGMRGMPFSNSKILEKLNQGVWQKEQCRKRSGTKAFEYHIDALPALAQADIYSRREDTQKSKNLSFNLWQIYSIANNNRKDSAMKRLEIINEYLEIQATCKTNAKAMQEICKKYKVSSATIYRYLEMIRGKSRSDWLPALLPNTHLRGRLKSNMSIEAWELLKADYLRLEQPTLRACYTRINFLAKEKNWTVPSYKTVQRKIAKIPMTTKVLKRQGEYALARLYPAQQRTVKDMHAMQWLSGDGYTHNVFVKFSDGTIARPKTWVFQDVYSRKIVSHKIDRSENKEQIRLALKDAIEKYAIPEHITIDNTRAAANKWLTGGVKTRYRFKVKEDEPKGIFPLLGIKTHFTSIIGSKGWGQAKPVERAFGIGGLGEYVDKDPLFAGAYTGNKVDAKPDNYGKTAIDIKEFEKILASRIAMFNQLAERRTEMAQGKFSFNDVFNESYKKSSLKQATKEQMRLLLLAGENIKVLRDGTFYLEAGSGYLVGKNRYGADELINYKHKTITVRFEPSELHKGVFAYSVDGDFIGKIPCITASAYGDSQKAREQAKRRRAFIKSTKKANKLEEEHTKEMFKSRMIDGDLVDLDTGEILKEQVAGLEFSEVAQTPSISKVDFSNDEKTKEIQSEVLNFDYQKLKTKEQQEEQDTLQDLDFTNLEPIQEEQEQPEEFFSSLDLEEKSDDTDGVSLDGFDFQSLINNKTQED